MNRGLNGGGPNLSGAAMLAARPQQQPMQIAAPINDVQLISLVACQIAGSPQERVAFAQKIVAEAFKTHARFGELLQEPKPE